MAYTDEELKREIGVAAIFMWQGFWDALHKQRVAPYGVKHDFTHDSQARLVAELASEVAVETLDYIDAHPNIDYPGVFEYEVYEMSLGWWLAAHFKDGDWPSAVEMVQHHHDVMDEWFDQLDEEVTA